MKNEIINRIIIALADLPTNRLSKLQYQLAEILNEYDIKKTTTELSTHIEQRIDLVQRFLVAKKVEGLAQSSLNCYANAIKFFLKNINKPLNLMDTTDIRVFLARYGSNPNTSLRTVDNMRRFLSSFYNWLFAEELIMSNPMLRIKQIKFDRRMKTAFSAEEMELIREACEDIRDRAMIEFLYSTGCRIREVVSLNKNDIDWKQNQVIVFGKGHKERICYINARARVHLEKYLESRKDNNEALFVSKLKPYNRINISGAEIVLRDIGKKIGIHIHPHRFRRTAATIALNNGMPFEQVRLMLGHSSPSTTMLYTTVDQNQLKINHQKYLQ